MTTTELRAELKTEMGQLITTRSYLNSQDVRVMLIDAYYPDDAPRVADFVQALGLTVELITATPFGAPPRRRIVVTGFTTKTAPTVVITNGEITANDDTDNRDEYVTCDRCARKFQIKHRICLCRG